MPSKREPAGRFLSGLWVTLKQPRIDLIVHGIDPLINSVQDLRTEFPTSTQADEGERYPNISTAPTIAESMSDDIDAVTPGFKDELRQLQQLTARYEVVWSETKETLEETPIQEFDTETLNRVTEIMTEIGTQYGPGFQDTVPFQRLENLKRTTFAYCVLYVAPTAVSNRAWIADNWAEAAELFEAFQDSDSVAQQFDELESLVDEITDSCARIEASATQARKDVKNEHDILESEITNRKRE